MVTGNASILLAVCARSVANTVASKHAKDQEDFSPRHASGVSRARGKQDACAPIIYLIASLKTCPTLLLGNSILRIVASVGAMSSGLLAR